MTIQIEQTPPCVTMDGVSWDYYTQTLRELGPSRNVRITFDNGRMEIVTTSNRHERIKSIIRRLIEAYSVAAEVPATCDGALTLRKESLRRGLEPDECYYVQTPPPPASDGEFDLTIYPPPDLALEVEISHGSISKLPIYAALGIGEVWRFDGERVLVLCLGHDGKYGRVDRSVNFPALSMHEFNRWIDIAIKSSQHEAVKELHKWVRGRR
jgi:Uma2 family endonuclease